MQELQCIDCCDEDCESQFVARGETFDEAADRLLQHIREQHASYISGLDRDQERAMAQDWARFVTIR